MNLRIPALRVVMVTSIVLVAGSLSLVRGATGVTRSSTAGVFVRVDQVGYPTDGPKVAYVMSGTKLSGTPFQVRDGSGTVVFTGMLGDSAKKWNARYPYVYPISITGLVTPGTDSITVEGSPTTPATTSPSFQIDAPSSLWSQGLVNALSFYQNERDGPDDIPSALRTAPAHLNDEHAMTYETPVMKNSGAFSGDLTALGTTMDASGGWWDAGDYLKFVETTSYVVAMMGAGVLSFPDQMGSGAGNSDFVSEFQFGVQWLEKMWNDSTKTLYYQVGIGEGNTQTVGDHDIWRLPQADDTYGGTNPLYRYIRNRPVFEAGPPGSPISPNLAGRLAADFGLCAQVFVSSDPSLAASCLEDGEDVYALADTDPTGRLLTTAPYVFYPETQWRDDMELGATELAAAVGPGPQQNAYMTDAAQWAAACMASADQDTLNLYDVGGLAHYELARLITGTGATGLAVTPTMLVDQLRSQIEGAVAVGRKFPFAFGYPWSASDTVSHGAGLSVMASEYDALTGTTTFAAEAQGWLDNILGANPWGVSFIIGDGSTFPLCPQHQVANLVGSTNGTTPILAGRPSKDPPMRRPEAWSAVWSPVPSAAGTPMPRSTGTGLSTWTTCSRTPPTNRPSISPPPHPWPWPGWLQPGRRARPHDDRSGFGKRSVVMVEAKGIARVGVVGCGLMGSGIVEVCARAGLDVRVVEVDVGALEAGQKRVETSLQRAAAAGKMAPDEATSALDRIDFTTDFESLADRQLIVEAVVESEAEKLDVFERLDHVLEDDSAVLASNTSSIPIMKLAMATRRPAQVIGIHFFNPVPVLPLVEVVTSLMTSEETADLAEEFARTVLGKHVIRSKDRAGFIVNALLVPYLLSAIRMFESGFATAEDIDAGMTKGCAHPMGPLALSDLIGLDTTMAVANSLYEEFKEPLYAPPPLLARMVEAGLFGRKSGRGFYDYQKH